MTALYKCQVTVKVWCDASCHSLASRYVVSEWQGQKAENTTTHLEWGQALTHTQIQHLCYICQYPKLCINSTPSHPQSTGRHPNLLGGPSTLPTGPRTGARPLSCFPLPLNGFSPILRKTECRTTLTTEAPGLTVIPGAIQMVTQITPPITEHDRVSRTAFKTTTTHTASIIMCGRAYTGQPSTRSPVTRLPFQSRDCLGRPTSLRFPAHPRQRPFWWNSD